MCSQIRCFTSHFICLPDIFTVAIWATNFANAALLTQLRPAHMNRLNAFVIFGTYVIAIRSSSGCVCDSLWVKRKDICSRLTLSACFFDRTVDEWFVITINVREMNDVVVFILIIGHRQRCTTELKAAILCWCAQKKSFICLLLLLFSCKRKNQVNDQIFLYSNPKIIVHVTNKLLLHMWTWCYRNGYWLRWKSYQNRMLLSWQTCRQRIEAKYVVKCHWCSVLSCFVFSSPIQLKIWTKK